MQKPDNSKDVKIGTLIALMVEEGEDWKDVEAPAGEDVVPSGGEEQEQAPVSAGGGNVTLCCCSDFNTLNTLSIT